VAPDATRNTRSQLGRDIRCFKNGRPRSQRRLYLDGAELARELPIAEAAFSHPPQAKQENHGMEIQRYDVRAPDGHFVERYWRPGVPV
jgi:hypothetical protein